MTVQNMDLNTDKNFAWPVSLILVVAAAFKAHQISTSPASEHLIFDSRITTIFAIEFELLLAVWLFAGAWQNASKIVGLVTFGGFAMVATFKLANGESNCGCFGHLDVHPAISLIVDFVAIILLSLPSSRARRKKPSRAKPSGVKISLYTVAGTSLMAVILFSMLSPTTAKLDPHGEIVGEDGIVILEPATWIGEPLPIAGFIANSTEFMSGSVRLVFYHYNCPKCRLLITETFRDTQADHELTTVFIEVPPYNSPPRIERPGILWRRLSDQRRWFMITPSIVYIENGSVEAVESTAG